MFEGIKNYYLKKEVKRQVELFYLQLGINPKELENLTMQEILKKVDYAMKNLIGWREEYYNNLDKVVDLNQEIIGLNAMMKDLDRQILALEGENTKYKIKNDFLTNQNKTYEIANNKRVVEAVKNKSTVVSYERG